MPSTPHTLTTAEYQALQVGMPKYCSSLVVTIAGQTYTVTQLVALIASLLNASLAIAPAKGAWLAAVAANRAAKEANSEIVKEAREVVGLMFKNDPQTLADLAITPRKSPRPLTAEARAAANAKTKATRIARGTAGKKQKSLVSGNVTGVSIVPITSSAPAATPTAPAALSSSSSAAPRT